MSQLKKAAEEYSKQCGVDTHEKERLNAFLAGAQHEQKRAENLLNICKELIYQHSRTFSNPEPRNPISELILQLQIETKDYEAGK